MIRWLRPPRTLKTTLEGKVFLVITLGVGFAAVNTGNNLLFLALGMLLSLILVSGLLSELSLREVKVRRRLPKAAHAGRPALFEIFLENDKAFFTSFSLEVAEWEVKRKEDGRSYPDRHSGSARPACFLRVVAGREEKSTGECHFTRRGLYDLRGFRLSTRYPFSIFIKSRTIEAPAELLVYPRLRQVEPVPLAGSLREGREGRAPRPVRHGMNFHSLRDFSPEDDARHIHWKASARHGRLLTREYEREGDKRVVIYLDNTMPATPTGVSLEGMEEVVEAAAAFAVRFLDEGYHVGLVTRNDRLPLGQGVTQRHHILRHLALTPILEPAPAAAEPPPPGAASLLVTHARITDTSWGPPGAATRVTVG